MRHRRSLGTMMQQAWCMLVRHRSGRVADWSIGAGSPQMAIPRHAVCGWISSSATRSLGLAPSGRASLAFWHFQRERLRQGRPGGLSDLTEGGCPLDKVYCNQDRTFWTSRTCVAMQTAWRVLFTTMHFGLLVSGLRALGRVSFLFCLSSVSPGMSKGRAYRGCAEHI